MVSPLYTQELRTRILETLIQYEGLLDTRMYGCADYLATAGLVSDTSHMIQGWNTWKTEHTSDGYHVKL